MGSRKIIMLIGSILLGALAGFALLNYIRGVEDEVLQDTARVQVWVVAQDIPAGTTATDVIQTGRLEEREVESSFRPTTSVTDLSQIQGRIAVGNLAANQILVQGMFDDPEIVETTFADLVADDQVAISITLPKNRAVAGFIEPGDFVDIIALGDPLPPVGEDDAFDTSARQTPYQRPARYLYRGVRIVAINGEIVGDGFASGEEELPLPEGGEEVASLELTFAIPAEAAQRILSVPESNITLSLLPDAWSPEARPNDVLDAILTDEDLPGENPQIVTPYGREGFVDPFDTQNDADAAGGSATSDSGSVTDSVAEPAETDPATESSDTAGDDEETEEG